jgi:hypothetical protein
MPIYEIKADRLDPPLKETAFSDEDVRERRDLQRLIKDQITIICPDTMVLAEEFGDFESSRRRIDLLCLDRQANLVVVELKRTETGGHMELQAIRYASMVSTMTFDQVVSAHEHYLSDAGKDASVARAAVLDFLGWEEPGEGEFGAIVRIVLASAEFSKELTTAVMWLNEYGLDIQCWRLRPYRLDDRLLLDVQQVIPLPEAADYQERVRVRIEERREALQSSRVRTKYDLSIGAEDFTDLTKGELAYFVAREATRQGATPDSLRTTIPSKQNTLWVSVDGEVERNEFIERAKAVRLQTGPSFDPIRYFLADDKLIHHDGKTYAFTNQWGQSTLSFVDKVISHLDTSEIRYKART